MNLKEMAKDFLKLAATGNTKVAYEKYIASNFIHHNQYTKNGRAELMKGMEDAHKASPNKGIDVKHIYQEGNTVITHSEVLRSEGPNIAVVHILKFEGQKVVEFWDVAMMMNEDSPNADGVF